MFRHLHRNVCIYIFRFPSLVVHILSFASFLGSVVLPGPSHSYLFYDVWCKSLSAAHKQPEIGWTTKCQNTYLKFHRCGTNLHTPSLFFCRNRKTHTSFVLSTRTYTHAGTYRHTHTTLKRTSHTDSNFLSIDYFLVAAAALLFRAVHSFTCGRHQPTSLTQYTSETGMRMSLSILRNILWALQMEFGDMWRQWWLFSSTRLL